MMSRWFAFKRTSSSNGKSHSMRTSTVCISRNILVTFSKPIIQPMYCSSIASRNGRLSRRLSILGTGCMAILSLSLNAMVPTKIQWFLKPYTQLLPGSDFINQLHSRTPTTCLETRQMVGVLACPNIYCVSRTYSKPQPVIQVNVQTSLYLTHLKTSCRSVYCPNTSLVSPGLLLPTSACRDTLNADLQAGCRSLHCPNTSLVSPGLTPNLSLSRYSKHFKTCHLRQSIDKSPPTNDLTVNMPQK